MASANPANRPNPFLRPGQLVQLTDTGGEMYPGLVMSVDLNGLGLSHENSSLVFWPWPSVERVSVLVQPEEVR